MTIFLIFMFCFFFILKLDSQHDIRDLKDKEQLRLAENHELIEVIILRRGFANKIITATSIPAFLL